MSPELRELKRFPLESPEKIRYTDINWFYFGHIRLRGENKTYK